MTQEVKCTDCGYVLATINARDNKIKFTMPNDPQEYLLSNTAHLLICPGCGMENKIY